MKMKKLFEVLGALFMIGGFIFILTHSFIVTVSPDESFARDLFGFPIPHPPVWTSYIPYLGSLLGFTFEFFSMHGLVGLVISGVLLCIGIYLIGFGNSKEDVKSRQREIEEITANPNLPDVIKQEFIKGIEKQKSQ